MFLTSRGCTDPLSSIANPVCISNTKNPVTKSQVVSIADLKSCIWAAKLSKVTLHKTKMSYADGSMISVVNAYGKRAVAHANLADLAQ